MVHGARCEVCSFIITLFFLILAPSTWHLAPLFAEISKSEKFRLEAGGFVAGGGETKGTKFQVPVTTLGDIAATVPTTEAAVGGAGGKPKSTLTPGLVPVLTKEAGGLPVEPFDIEEVFAKSQVGGVTITQAAWQKDNDPYFYWTVEGSEEGILGYSFALDTVPDETIDAKGDSYQYPNDSIADGKHTFHVIAQSTAGKWGREGSFEIWVDATKPLILSFMPGNKALLNSDKPTITLELKDDASGIDPDSIRLTVNGSKVTHQYDAAASRVSYTPMSSLSDGLNSLRFDMKDLVGNEIATLLWSFTIDTKPPTGKIVINHDEKKTTSIQVRLDLEAQDITTTVKEMMISNRPDLVGGRWEPFISTKDPWVLEPISGLRTVYVKFKDEVGNESLVYSDSIELTIIAPDTLITSGPSGVTDQTTSIFTYSASEEGCQFKYQIDTGQWSDWTTQTTLTLTDVKEGNHYFAVKAGKDVDGNGTIDLDEEDPTPATRTWTVSATAGGEAGTIEPEQPVKYWYKE